MRRDDDVAFGPDELEADVEHLARAGIGAHHHGLGAVGAAEVAHFIGQQQRARRSFDEQLLAQLELLDGRAAVGHAAGQLLGKELAQPGRLGERIHIHQGGHKHGLGRVELHLVEQGIGRLVVDGDEVGLDGGVVVHRAAARQHHRQTQQQGGEPAGHHQSPTTFHCRSGVGTGLASPW